MEAIERRIRSLEIRVLGRGDQESLPEGGAVKALTKIAERCGNAVERKGPDRIAPLLRRTAELERYLDPTFAEDYGGVPPDVKAETALAREQAIRDAVTMLERVEKAKKIALDNGKDGFGKAAELEPRLRRLARIQLNQEDESAKLTAETLELVARYNAAVDALSEAFVRQDTLLRAAEERKNRRKTEDL